MQVVHGRVIQDVFDRHHPARDQACHNIGSRFLGDLKGGDKDSGGSVFGRKPADFYSIYIYGRPDEIRIFIRAAITQVSHFMRISLCSPRRVFATSPRRRYAVLKLQLLSPSWTRSAGIWRPV